MLPLVFILFSVVSAATPSYKECTQCEYAQQPRPFTNDVDIITDKSFDLSCVAAQYTSFHYCLKKACNRNEDNARNGFLHYPCERWIPKQCPHCGEHGRCVNVTKKMYSNGYCTEGLKGPIDIRNTGKLAECEDGGNRQFFVVNKDRTECYEMTDMSHCDRGGVHWVKDHNYDSYVQTHTCVCDEGWSGLECKENDACCAEYSVQCLACHAGKEPWEFCSDLLNVAPYNPQQAQELGCAKILESRSGITGLQYKHLSYVCNGPSDDASATWKVDGETCADYARKIKDTDIWRCAASGHIDFSNHALPTPNDVCCACGYKIPKPAVDCIGQWTDKGVEGEDCGTYIITQEAEGEGTKCPVVGGTTITCSVQSQDCKGVWTKVGPQGDQCGKFIITQPAVGSGQECLSENGAERECLLGDNCRLTGGEEVKDTWHGMDTADNYCNTCSCNDGVLLCTLMACTGDKPCTLTGGESVPPAWKGHDTGINYCNTCQCNDGDLLCTKIACAPKCPIPGCIEPPEGCEYRDSPELDENLCPKYPCGKLHCVENMEAEITRMAMSRDKSVVQLYYTGAPENAFIGVVVATAYANLNDIPFDSRDIVAKVQLGQSRDEGQESFNLMTVGGPFFAVMWNAQGEEISERVLFDKFDAKFLSENCPKKGEADRQFPWHDALSQAGGESNTCDDYAKFENGEWRCDLAIAGWDSDRDTTTAGNTCCACDYSGRLYAEWAHDAGETPWSCDLQCPQVPHYHSIEQTFYYMIGINSSCNTVHLRSCGGETVWSPCSSSAPCRYKPKTPNTLETSLIYMAQRIYEQDLHGFSGKAQEYIWGIQQNISDNQKMLHHLTMMHDKIDRIKELEKELNAVVVPVHIDGNIIYNENSDWLGKLVDKAREDLLYRDLSTYPKLIQRLHEISNMIQHGEQNVAKEIRHAMRYDLTVLIEDVNKMEEDQDIVNANLGNRTSSLEFTVDQIQDAIWAVEQSQLGLSSMVKLELAHIKSELEKGSSEREQIFARLAELTLIAVHFEHELYKNAVNDTRHDDAIDALENEVALIKFIHNANMTSINKQIHYIKENMEDTNWKIDSHIESVGWAIDMMRKDINNFEEDVVTRLQIMEVGYAQSELQIGQAIDFLDNKMNGIYEAILNKASIDELALLEEALYASEISLIKYADMMANETRDRTERMIEDMRWLMMDKFNELGQVPTVSEIDAMIQLSFEQGLAEAKAYSDDIRDNIFQIAQDTATWVGNLTLHEAKTYADTQAMVAKAEAATFSESLVMNATTALHEFIEHQQFTTGDEVRDIVVNSLFPIFDDDITNKVEALIAQERNIMFLTLEQRAAELEQYAQTVAETAAMQAKIAATNEAVAMVENLRHEMVNLNTSLWNELGTLSSDVGTIKETLSHLNGQINTLNSMIEVVEQDIVHTNINVDDTNRELSLLRLKLNEIIKSIDDFKSDVQRDYVSKENWDASQVIFEAWKQSQEETYQQSLRRFEQIEATMQSLDLETTALFVSQDQKILFLQQELNALRDMLGDTNDVISAIQGELSVLNKIQEDYPSVNLNNQLLELRAKIDTAAEDIIEHHARLTYNIGNITDIRVILSQMEGDLDDQRRDLLTLENQVMSGGGGGGNVTSLIEALQHKIDEKADADQLVAAQEDINFQKQQLEQLAEKINNIQVGNGSSGVDLATAERLAVLEQQVSALQNSSFGCGSGEIDIDCGPMVESLFKTMANMTFSTSPNDARVDEILAALSNFDGDMGGFIAEVLGVLDGGSGSSVSPTVIANIQQRLVSLEEFDSQMEIAHKQYVLESRNELRDLRQKLENLITISSSNREEIEEIQRTVTYIASEIEILPVMQNSIDYLFGVYHRLENATFYLTDRNKRAIDVLNETLSGVLPTLDILGQEAEILRLELTSEVAQIRSEFLDLPDSPRILDYIGNINEKLANVSMEVLLVSQRQTHYEFQMNRLDIMRADLNHLANMTAKLYDMTLNSSHKLVINASDLDPDMNKTLAPLIRRIEIMESVVNAHKEMNFSKQIMSLHSVIEHHTQHIHSLLSQADNSVELTESQLTELAERIAALEPSQEVLHIRDELDRLVLLEKNFPLINMSTEIHQLSQRISVFETLLPPETLEAILEDIATLKQQIENNPNTGQILMIQTEIAQLVQATEEHAGHLEDLDAINQLMLEHSDDRDVQIAEIYVELETLENAINSVINGQVEDLGIPNVIQELRDDDQHTRDMISALESQLNDLKHTLRYYETCLHTHDCHPGQRCNKHSECLWNEASVVCAWEKLGCGMKCHYNGHCRMLKHVWETEFVSSCPASNCSDYVINDDDLSLELNGPAKVNLTLGEDMEWNDPGAYCTDDMWKYDVEVSVYPAFRTDVVNDYTFTYSCGHSLTKQRIVSVRYPVCDLSHWIVCPDGTRSFERKDRGCTIECDPSSKCSKPRYAGPACRCSPILDGCRDWYGDVEATWDGEKCGCKCNGKLLSNNQCV